MPCLVGSLSHPLPLVLVPLVPIALCIIFVKALMILIFVLTILSGRCYVLLNSAWLPSTSNRTQKIEWVDGWDGWDWC